MSPIRQEHPLSKKPNAKGMRAETAFLGKRLLGIFPNRNMTVIVMMEKTPTSSIISYEPPVFNRFFHIF